MKKFLLGFILVVVCVGSAFSTNTDEMEANPKSIHYSAMGDYLVDENGNRTEIHGHPYLVCHREKGDCTIEGPFIKAKGSTVWLTGKLWCGHDMNDWQVEVPNATCDLQ